MAYRRIVNRINISELESTQDWAKAHYREFASNRWTAISADSQQAGRGQFDASWQDVPGAALLVTWVSPDVSWPANTLWARQMSVSIAWARALRATGRDVLIKWPNDLMLGDRKLAGMLTEAMWRGNSCHRYFVGIGMNVSDAPPNAAFLGADERVSDWIERLLVPTAEAIMRPLPQDQLSDYTELLMGWKQWVAWEDPVNHEHIIAKPVEIDREGRLCVELENGTRHWLRPRTWIWKGLVERDK